MAYILLDGKKVVLDREAVCGALIKGMLGKDASYNLYKDTGEKYWEHPLMKDMELFVPVDGEEFYTVPRTDISGHVYSNDW